MEPFQSIIRDPTCNNDRYEQRQGQLRNIWAMARQRDKHRTTVVFSLNRCRGLVTSSVAVNHRLEFESLSKGWKFHKKSIVRAFADGGFDCRVYLRSDDDQC